MQKEFDEKLTQHYRWQFLRLNSGYRELYDRYMNIPENYRNPAVDLEAEELFEEFKITNFYDYNQKILPPSIKIIGLYDSPIQTIPIEEIPLEGNQERNGCYILEKNDLKKDATISKDLHLSIKYLQLVIDCDANISDIKSHIENKIKKIQIHRKNLPKKFINVKSKKNHSVEYYEDLLKTYDFKFNKNLKNVEIAKTLHTQYDDIRLAESLVAKQLKKCEGLIKNKYLNILIFKS